MTTFEAALDGISWDAVQLSIQNKTAEEVQRALTAAHPTVADLAALLSPAAVPFLEQLAQKSSSSTRHHFGNTIQMYAPLYLSNECTNVCTYCGFSLTNKVARLTLNPSQIEREIQVLRAYGYEHVLVVTGESAKAVGMQYFQDSLDLLTQHFSHVTFEVQPLEEDEYRTLRTHGLHAVLVYQETYHREEYRTHHQRGKKAHYSYRLATPERLGRAGIQKIGLGVLLGLEEWRTDLWHLGLHLAYLRKRFWRTKFSISFPRLRPAEGIIEPKYTVSDKELVQAICAFRIFDPHVEISLSTRESPTFRDNAVRIGITSMSAGSKTEPGGYALKESALEQFVISDERSVTEVTQAIQNAGYEPVWKDWEPCYATSELF